MATSKRASRKSRSSKATGGKKSRSSRARKGPGFVLRTREWLGEAVTLEVFGGVLLVAGLFLSAAFISGRGAFLGDAGRSVATHLMGALGLLLAPLAALAGLLLLVRRFPGRRGLGAALLLVAGATTLAARLPRESLFSSKFYAEAGGIVGSGIYGAVYWSGGTVGAALALCVMYALGLSLLTGVAFGSALGVMRGGGGWILGRLRDWAKKEFAHSGRDDSGGAVERVVASDARAEISRSEISRSEISRSEISRSEISSSKEEDDEAEQTAELEVVLSGRPEVTPFVGDRGIPPGDYTPPPPSLLNLGRGSPEHDAEGTSRRLTRALADLGVEAQVLRAVVGPRVTRYELRLGSGVKVGKVRNLQQDIAYALAATEVRILAPIPGKSAVGVEVPNTRAATVTLGDVFQEYPEGNDWTLPVGLGKDISGRAVYFDLAEMPHLLVAGTTGSGKSVMLNALLTSLLLTTDPRQVKMVLIDPKRVELSYFGQIPHLITPVVTDVKKAANALGWAVSEMERRYEVLEKVGVRSLEGYNARSEIPMPYVVLVIDELADLMMQAAAKVEDAVIRLAQKARAVGIHLVIATQRPSVDVITGMIKANVPSRIAFAVSSQVDSRVILDSPGAESLLGMGDMLFKPVSAARASRVQGAFISEAEVERIVSATVTASRASGNAEATYVEEVTEPKSDPKEAEEPDDELLPDAASFVVATQQASVSAVQRRFRVGYSRAGRIIDALERKGIVGPYEGSKSRSVVATELDLQSIFGAGSGGAAGASPDPEFGGASDESW